MLLLLYHNTYYLYYPLSLPTGSDILQTEISMVEIPDMALIFIKQYQICLCIKEVLIIWDSRFSLPTYITDMSCNVRS
jgi:hypothetical protein